MIDRLLLPIALAALAAGANTSRPIQQDTAATNATTSRSETKYHWCFGKYRGDSGPQLVITDQTFAETHEDNEAGKVERAMQKQFREQIEDEFSHKFDEVSCRSYAYDRIQAEVERSQMKIYWVGSNARGSLHEVSFSFDASDLH